MSTGPDDPMASILIEAERNRRSERAASASAGSNSTPSAIGDDTAAGIGGGNMVTLDANGKIPSRFLYASGGGGGPALYEHVQTTAATVWTIRHDLGARPQVTVIDQSGQELQVETHYPDPATTVQLVFGRPTAGVAQLNL